MWTDERGFNDKGFFASIFSVLVHYNGVLITNSNDNSNSNYICMFYINGYFRVIFTRSSVESFKMCTGINGP